MSTPKPVSLMRDPLSPDARYECLVKIASGGMGTVYVGRLRGRYGFTRLVAIKRAHPHLVDDASLRRSLIAEARVASRIHHPNVVSVLDIEESRDELLLVMDYVEGPSLSQLEQEAQRQERTLPVGAVVRVLLDACAGLHAAHELKDEQDAPLQLVHRDVSPQNVLVGADGVSRIADFGIAKSAESTQATHTGLRGKLAYMAPEYVRDRTLDRRVDVFALGIVAWEALSGRRLFRGDGELETLNRIISHEPERLSSVAPWVPAAFDDVVARALCRDPGARTPSAAELGRELEEAARSAGLDTSNAAVAAVVRELYGPALEARRGVLREQLASHGEPSSQVSALLAGRVEDPQTQTASARLSLADARTLPLERKLEPVASSTGDGDALALSAKSPPRRSGLAPLALVGVLGAGVVATWLALRGPADPSAGAAGEAPTAPSAAAATTSAALATAAGASGVSAIAAPLHGGDDAASTATTGPTSGALTSASGSARLAHRAVHHATKPSAAPTSTPPSPPPASPPPATARTSRPSLGY